MFETESVNFGYFAVHFLEKRIVCEFCGNYIFYVGAMQFCPKVSQDGAELEW